MKAQIKDLRDGYMVKVTGIEATLYQSKEDHKWYALSSSSGLDGNKPPEWDSLRSTYACSFWIADSTCIETSYDVELLYDLDRIEKIIPKTESKPTFKPKIGDILHIMSEADIKKFNSMERLQAGGDYFGYHLEVTSLSGDNAVFGNIFHKSGDLVISGWGVWLKDFYEYHGINPPSYATPYLVVRKEFDGSTTRRIESKHKHSTIDSSGSMSFGSISKPIDYSRVSGGGYSSISGGSSSSVLGSSLSKSYVDEMSHASSEYIKKLVKEEKIKAMEEYVSKESIKHEGSRCTLPHTSDWQIAGDSVPRRRATDMLLILGL